MVIRERWSKNTLADSIQVSLPVYKENDKLFLSHLVLGCYETTPHESPNPFSYKTCICSRCMRMLEPHTLLILSSYLLGKSFLSSLPVLKAPVMANLSCQCDTLGKEGISVKELPLPDWAVCVVLIDDSCWAGLACCGQCHACTGGSW